MQINENGFSSVRQLMNPYNHNRLLSSAGKCCKNVITLRYFNVGECYIDVSIITFPYSDFNYQPVNPAFTLSQSKFFFSLVVLWGFSRVFLLIDFPLKLFVHLTYLDYQRGQLYYLNGTNVTTTSTDNGLITIEVPFENSIQTYALRYRPNFGEYSMDDLNDSPFAKVYTQWNYKLWDDFVRQWSNVGIMNIIVKVMLFQYDSK
jgi:hypothetical protein